MTDFNESADVDSIIERLLDGMLLHSFAHHSMGATVYLHAMQKSHCYKLG